MPSKKSKKARANKFWNTVNLQSVSRANVIPNLTGHPRPRQKRNMPNSTNNLPSSAGCPKIMDVEDFTEDLVDDSVFNLIPTTNVTNTTPSPATTVSPFTLGAKIPVKIRENAAGKTPNQQHKASKKGDNINTQGHSTSNRQLKDCLTSDIKTVVQDKIRWDVRTPTVNSPAVLQQNFVQPLHKPIHSPSGVPRSFLTRIDQTVIEPQDAVPIQPITRNFTQTIQRPYNQPITHSGIRQVTPVNNPMQVGPNMQTFQNPSTRYSPTDLYDDLERVGQKEDNEDDRENSTSPDIWQSGEKRVSAFERLGPLSQPKKPKLTINLSFDKEQPVREVVDESKEQETVYVPVYQREDVLHSTDETVMKYVALWPWAKHVSVRRTAMNKFKVYITTKMDEKDRNI